jgi:hypothetical protein
VLHFFKYIRAAENWGNVDEGSFLIPMGKSFRGGITKSTKAGDFSRVHQVQLERTFNKNQQTARKVLENPCILVPFGHLYDESTPEERYVVQNYDPEARINELIELDKQSS